MPSQARLIVTGPDGQRNTYFLSPGSLTIGRRSDCDIVILDAKVSRQHARLDCTSDGCRVTDLGSAQGTWVNGQRSGEASLSDGDEVKLGGFTVRFEDAIAKRPVASSDEVTIQAGIEPDLDEPADMEATMATQSVEHSLSDTSVPRVVVYGPGVASETAIGEDRVTIGRGQENTIVVDDRMISRHHAVLEREANRALLRDLGSANGTWARQGRVSQCYLYHGDSFRIGFPPPPGLIYKRAVQRAARAGPQGRGDDSARRQRQAGQAARRLSCRASWASNFIAATR